MIKYIQISGFIENEGFYSTAGKVLQKAIVNQEKCVFIASKTEEFRANDERMQCISGWFRALNIEFKQIAVMDERLTKQEVMNEIVSASCIYLMGGNTKRQFEFIHQYELAEALKNFEGVVVGLSAGAINMAKLGLVDSYVIPHFGNYNKEYLEAEIMPRTYERIIYGLHDDGVIAHSDNNTFYAGEIFELKEGVVRPFSQFSTNQ